jgi:hypothetical protein
MTTETRILQEKTGARAVDKELHGKGTDRRITNMGSPNHVYRISVLFVEHVQRRSNNEMHKLPGIV